MNPIGQPVSSVSPTSSAPFLSRQLGAPTSMHAIPQTAQGNINPSLGNIAFPGGAPSSMKQPSSLDVPAEEPEIFMLLSSLFNPKERGQALSELSRKRETCEELGVFIWNSFGVVTILLQEVMSVYPLLQPPNLTNHASNRVCDALALLQCVASHPETRLNFLNAHIVLYLYPFLNIANKTRPFEYIRLTALGVIGALVKHQDNAKVVQFLLSTEIIPLCLKIMESGTEISKTISVFIIQKILLDETGLNYICQTYERFFAVATVLEFMVYELLETKSLRVLKPVIRCYARLSEHTRAREALRQCLPEPLRSGSFTPLLKDDVTTKRYLAQMLLNLSDNVVPNT